MNTTTGQHLPTSDSSRNTPQPITFESIIEHSTPRYGPLPSLLMSGGGGGSVPTARRYPRSQAPPAYSDLDETSEQLMMMETNEPRYQPMPMHSISRRPLPSQPGANIINNNPRKGSLRGVGGNDSVRSTPLKRDLATRASRFSGSAASSDSHVEGDYEDISQL